MRKLEKLNLKKGRNSWEGSWDVFSYNVCIHWYIERPLCRSTCRENQEKPHYLTFLHRKHGCVVSWALICKDWILCYTLTTAPHSTYAEFSFPPYTPSLCLPLMGLTLLHFVALLPVSCWPSFLLLFRTRALIELLSFRRNGRNVPDKHLSAAVCSKASPAAFYPPQDGSIHLRDKVQVDPTNKRDNCR